MSARGTTAYIKRQTARIGARAGKGKEVRLSRISERAEENDRSSEEEQEEEGQNGQ